MGILDEKARDYTSRLCNQTGIYTKDSKDYHSGEMRILRGYKKQFVSRDGKYSCIDLDIKQTEKETGERLVNINTITELIFNGVKYVIK